MTHTSVVKQRNQHNRLYLIPTIATKQRNLSIAGFFTEIKPIFVNQSSNEKMNFSMSYCLLLIADIIRYTVSSNQQLLSIDAD